MSLLKEIYQKKIANNEINSDINQEQIIDAFDKLEHELKLYKTKLSKFKFFNKIFKNRINVHDAPNGLYIYGKVGRGKTMIMNLFYDQSSFNLKRREHFHSFMLDIHKKVKIWRDKHKNDKKARDPLKHVAQKIAQKVKLLCLDELQILDITNAMIVYRLFAELINQGVVVIITSNRQPDDLYKDGLQRENFLPFIDLLKSKMKIYNLDSERDYRLNKLKSIKNIYFTPLGADANNFIMKMFKEFSVANKEVPIILNIMGRELKVKHAAGSVAMFSFKELCEKALGAADYIEIAQTFSVVILSDIPLMDAEHRNEAKRFVTLIDELYRHNVKLICSAASSPDQLYVKGTENFEFARTASRLHEMQSNEYFERDHISCNGEIKQ